MGKRRFSGVHHSRACPIARKVLFFLGGILLIFSGVVLPPGYAQGLVKEKVPLTKLAPVQSTQLRGSYNTYSLKLPIPARWEVEKAVLRFSYVNSTALLAGNSRLVIFLNGRALAQVTLEPRSPVGEVAVSLPPRLLKPGYQDLDFTVIQHYTLDCEDPTAPELWTTLELDKSLIEFDYRLKSVPLQLRAMTDFLFDPRISSENRVHLVVENLSPEQVELAGLAASGVALRFAYRPVILSLSHTLQPGMDNILVGDQKFVKGLLEDRSPENKGSSLTIMHLPIKEGAPTRKTLADRTRALLVISGENLEQVREAAKTFTSLSFPYPGTPSMEVKEIRFPAPGVSQGKGQLRAGEKYAFESLGFGSFTFRGSKPAPRSIDFRIPSHLWAKSNEFFWLSLHVAYGSGMRKDSVLNVFFNEKYVSSIFLDNPLGGTFLNYQIPIPAYLLKRGRNTLTFSPVLTPLITGRCEYIQTENLLLTIFGDSSLKTPPMTSWVDLPRLELFFQDGFPFTRWPDGRETIFYLTEKSLTTASSALNLLALCTQKIGYPLAEARFSYEPPKDQGKEILVVGPIGGVSRDLLKEAPLKFTREGSLSYPFWKKVAEEAAAEDSWIRRFWSRFISPPVMERGFTPAWAAFSQQVSGLGPERAILTQFQSPYKMGRSVLFLSASSSQEVLKGALALWEPAVQGRIGGDVAVVDLSLPDYPTTSVEMGSKYYVGEQGPVSRLSLILYSHPWLFFGLLILAFVILALGIYHLLKKYRQRRIGHERA